ncbi:DNA polymerase III subunit delta' [Sphingomonas sp. KR1UV-12]|uniref:DNA polymerase III subunit delta n=1 Tax=Sphingomonas aurea TaxID=3063994 RepID=A0ABT9EH57_9SPHN|nr:DNA polymerase III subunit delta' [Sphingomonas sp. KR1UV-12]MDP1026182.1 DNA polymerase III subunit delta' [Sphingomonas sp. KR1UV-12]
MTSGPGYRPLGNDAAKAAFVAALDSGALHHAWLLTGAEGIGKAGFARAAALRMLAEGAGEALPPGLAVPADSRTAALVAAGSHPDFRLLARLPKDADKPDGELARSISIAQVRALQPLFATAPSMSRRRVVVIDAIDDLERNAANALLKNLEEPPQGTIFLLVSHMPGRLLPTIRSRCRLLRFERLTDVEVGTIIRDALPDADAAEIAALVTAAEGAPGRGLRFAGLDLASVDAAIAAIANDGDPDNVRRAALARQLAGKAAQPRYEAFLDRVPAHIARVARTRTGAPLKTALDAHTAARDLAGAARGLSLDAGGTVWEMAGLLARLG